MQPGNKQLVKMLKEKDIAYISLLYDKYAAAMYGCILREVKEQKLAEEILYESFIQIDNHRESEDFNEKHLLLWMLNICRKLSLKTLQKINGEQILNHVSSSDK